jgi:hypothetical protein
MVSEQQEHLAGTGNTGAQKKFHYCQLLPAGMGLASRRYPAIIKVTVPRALGFIMG